MKTKDNIFNKTPQTTLRQQRKEAKTKEIQDKFKELTRQGFSTDYAVNEICNSTHLAPRTIINNYLNIREIKKEIIKNG